MTHSVRSALSAATAALAGDEAARESELLLQHAANRSRAWLYAHATDPLDAAVSARFEALVARRAAGEPVAYLTGRREFWSLDLAVTRDVLIPRPETERLVELALERVVRDAPARIADLGTGSGAVALALARERPRARIVATDRSEPALAVARGNAQRLGFDNVEFRSGDWYDAVDAARFDLIVSNPPYVAADDAHLRRGDLRHEPAAALASGADGLDAIRTLVAGAGAHLVAGGWLLLEHGFEQGAAVRALFALGGFVEIGTSVDLGGRDRVTGGRAPA